MLRLSSTKSSGSSASAARVRLQRALAADRVACADQRVRGSDQAGPSEELLLKLLATECPLPAGRA
ncbi:MAG: hypothetical protein AB4911_09230 [Oscillochloridaceae bacterium umkhey_bin13]